MGKKNEEISMIRGICALLVISVHLLPFVYDSLLKPFSCYLLGTFFFLSGYFLKGTPIGEQLKKRIAKIGKPFLRYFVVVALLGGLLLRFTQGMSLGEWCRSVISELVGKEALEVISPDFYVKTSLHRPMTVMWFFIQLILATFISIPILGICKDSVQRKSIAILICLTISSLLYSCFERCPFQAQMLFFEIGMMLAGNISKQTGFLSKDHIEETKAKVLFIVFGGVFTAMLFIANPGLTFMSHGQIGSFDSVIDVVLGSVQTIVGTLWLFEICTLLKKNDIIKRALSFVGNRSQDYVYIHLVIGWFLSFVGVPIGMDYLKTEAYTGTLSEKLMLVAVFIGNVILCTVYSKLLAKAKKARAA